MTNELSAWSVIKVGCFARSPALSATSSCNHCELAPRHEHSSGYISTGFFDLSGCKPHAHTRTQTPQPNMIPLPPQQFLQKASHQQVLGIKIYLVSLRMWNLVGWEQGHVMRVSQWSEWRTMMIKLPGSLLCVCGIHISSESVYAQGLELWVNMVCKITGPPC